MKINYINPTDGVIGGYYETGVVGTGIGSGSGYTIMKFPNKMEQNEDWSQRQILVKKETSKKVIEETEKELEKFYEVQTSKDGKADEKALQEIEKLKVQLRKEAQEIREREEAQRQKEINQIIQEAIANSKQENDKELSKLKKQIQEQKNMLNENKTDKNELAKLKKQIQEQQKQLNSMKTKEEARKKKEQNKKRYLKKVKNEFGNYHALVIGNNNYQQLPVLKTAIDDAHVIANILEKEYGFKVEKLIDSTRSQIVSTMSKYRKKLTTNDNLLIYYAGHGWLDKDADEGYWLPVDSDKEDSVNWISNATITTQVRAYNAKHVMIIADSCYSGKLSRGLNLQASKSEIPAHLMKMARHKTRVVLTSGDLEPVADDGGKGNHSLFNSELTKVLKGNNSVLTASELFNKILRPMMTNSDQKPRYSDVKKAGHDGGDFIFVKNIQN
jgi:hypothetical protein